MLRAVMNFFAGSCTVQVSAEHAAAALTVLQVGRWMHWQMRTETDGIVHWKMRCSDAARYQEACRPTGSEILVEEPRGMPALRRRYAGRWGIPFGVLLFAGIVWLSTSVVWRVEVSGNKKIDAGEIERGLDEFGFGVGSFFGGIDFDELQNSYLLRSEGLAWIAVNMEGTVAHVEVREASDGKSDPPRGEALANIVAAEDGQIMEVRVQSGRAAVGINDVVRRGDLLISGIMTVGEDGLRYEYAAGDVIAKVNRQIVGESPLSTEKITYTGRENVVKSLIFFGKQMNFYRKSSIEGGTYDTILSEKWAAFSDGIRIPFGIRTETQREYRAERIPLSTEEACRAARSRYHDALRALLAEAEILSIETSTSVKDGAVRVVGNIVCAADIAVTAEVPLR